MFYINDADLKEIQNSLNDAISEAIYQAEAANYGEDKVILKSAAIHFATLKRLGIHVRHEAQILDILKKHKIKIPIAANALLRTKLQSSYDILEKACNAISDVQIIFHNMKDSRAKTTIKALEAVMKAQEILNPMAEDEDIRIV